jgi:hypothetical protein
VAAATLLPTLVHIVIDSLAKAPSAVIIAMTISAAMRPYSTAVAPFDRDAGGEKSRSSSVCLFPKHGSPLAGMPERD